MLLHTIVYHYIAVYTNTCDYSWPLCATEFGNTTHSERRQVEDNYPVEVTYAIVGQYHEKLFMLPPTPSESAPLRHKIKKNRIGNRWPTSLKCVRGNVKTEGTSYVT